MEWSHWISSSIYTNKDLQILPILASFIISTCGVCLHLLRLLCFAHINVLARPVMERMYRLLLFMSLLRHHLRHRHRVQIRKWVDYLLLLKVLDRAECRSLQIAVIYPSPCVSYTQLFICLSLYLFISYLFLMSIYLFHNIRYSGNIGICPHVQRGDERFE